MNDSQLLFLFLVIFCVVRCMNGSCAPFNNCSGHGKCGRNSKCVCDDGWGSESDLALYKAPDCSQRTCPNDIAWSDLPKSNGTAHLPAECSNAGICNRKTGKCKCFSGFTGKACNRRTCINDCSGHGRCVSKRRAANMDDAQPIGINTNFSIYPSNATWEADVEYMCVCDSSWAAGYGSLNDPRVLATEWFGPDCSMRHCPSANNPNTPQNELDCWNGTIYNNAMEVGGKYSICQIDCAGQGICDYSTGTCTCFDGYYGIDCGSKVGVEIVVNVTVVEETDDYYY